ncbi:MAG: hypothetical protein JRF25_10560 [Deltaproteobacteria bacterium]|nr:hypothetical protein [Deltaproteobacteria bacterium]
MEDIFLKLQILPKVSKAEFAFDYYTDSPSWLLEEIAKHLFLSHNREEGFSFKTSFYTNDIRSSSKGIRCYLGPKNKKKEFVRLELQLNRSVIRKLNIEFPLYKSDLNKIDFLKLFCFRQIDWDKLVKNYVYRSKNKIKIRDKMKKSCLPQRVIGDIIGRWAMNGDSISVTKLADKLKELEVKNYQYFLPLCEHENNVIQQSANFGFNRFIRKSRQIYCN